VDEAARTGDAIEAFEKVVKAGGGLENGLQHGWTRSRNELTDTTTY
jgi:hypothetical protein